MIEPQKDFPWTFACHKQLSLEISFVFGEENIFSGKRRSSRCLARWAGLPVPENTSMPFDEKCFFVMNREIRTKGVTFKLAFHLEFDKLDIDKNKLFNKAICQIISSTQAFKFPASLHKVWLLVRKSFGKRNLHVSLNSHVFSCTALNWTSVI